LRARRWWGWPLVPVYAAGLWVKERFLGEPKKLTWPVVSVGSLSAGGAGKTPVVMALALMLKERGWGVDVLSRGYGRGGSGVELVAGSEEKQIPCEDDNKKGKGIDEGKDNGKTLAERFGDEPLLIARRTGVEVWVGADRYSAGAAAEGFAAAEESGRVLPHSMPTLASQVRESRMGHPEGRRSEGRQVYPDGRRVHLLDDGFQHRQLARAVDVVLVTVEDLEDALLPAGNRREGLGALRRADVVVVREEEVELVEPRLRVLMRERWPGSGEHTAGAKAPPSLPPGRPKAEALGYLEAGAAMKRESKALVWTVRRKLRFPAPLFVFGAGLRPVAFCAIARPEGFAEMLVKAGCGVVDTIFFADHHAYDMGDMERVVELAVGLKASGFVTTEKDAVKLTPGMMAKLETLGPVMVAALGCEFVFPERVARELEARITPGDSEA